MKRLTEGNIYSKTLDNGVTYYMHYLLMHPSKGPIVKIFTDHKCSHETELLGCTSVAIKDAYKVYGWQYAGWKVPCNQVIGNLLFFEAIKDREWHYLPPQILTSEPLFGVRLGPRVPEEFFHLPVLVNYGIEILEKWLLTGRNERAEKTVRGIWESIPRK